MLTLIKINEQLGSCNGSIGKYFKVLTFCTAAGSQIFENAVTTLNKYLNSIDDEKGCMRMQKLSVLPGES